MSAENKETSKDYIETPETNPVMESLVRPNVAALDDVLGKPFKLLDDGFFRVIE